MTHQNARSSDRVKKKKKKEIKHTAGKGCLTKTIQIHRGAESLRRGNRLVVDGSRGRRGRRGGGSVGRVLLFILGKLLVADAHAAGRAVDDADPAHDATWRIHGPAAAAHAETSVPIRRRLTLPRRRPLATVLQDGSPDSQLHAAPDKKKKDTN